MPGGHTEVMTAEEAPTTSAARFAQLQAAKAMQASAIDHDRLAILSEILATSSSTPDVHMEQARRYRIMAGNDRSLARTFLRLGRKP